MFLSTQPYNAFTLHIFRPKTYTESPWKKHLPMSQECGSYSSFIERWTHLEAFLGWRFLGGYDLLRNACYKL